MRLPNILVSCLAVAAAILLNATEAVAAPMWATFAGNLVFREDAVTGALVPTTEAFTGRLVFDPATDSAAHPDLYGGGGAFEDRFGGGTLETSHSGETLWALPVGTLTTDDAYGGFCCSPTAGGQIWFESRRSGALENVRYSAVTILRARAATAHPAENFSAYLLDAITERIAIEVLDGAFVESFGPDGASLGRTRMVVGGIGVFTAFGMVDPDATPVPEPGTLALLSSGAVAMLARRRRRRSAQPNRP